MELAALLASPKRNTRSAPRRSRSSEPPIFVIGHWRTGTTLLHDLFSVDPNLAYPTTFECFFPHHFLLTEEVLSKVMRGLLPKKRPQDDVPVGFDRPQEEEFGMMMLGEGTPYLTHAWPRFGPADTEYLDFKGVSDAEQKKWADAYMWFYRRLAAEAWRQAAGDEDAGQCRAAQVADQAVSRRALRLSRAQPARGVPSTVKLWRALYSTQGLHNPPNLDPWLDDYVLDMFARLTEDYEEDKHLIPKDRLVEMRYEDFVKDPVASMRDIYQRLDIPNFAQAEAPMREFLGERSEHKVSRYELPPALKRKVIDRLKPYIDRFGYRAAVEASPAGTRGEVAGARARAVLGLPKRRVGSAVRASCLGSVLLSVLDGLDLDRHRVHHIDDRLHLEFETPQTRWRNNECLSDCPSRRSCSRRSRRPGSRTDAP